MHDSALGTAQRFDKCVILFLVQRTVDVITVSFPVSVCRERLAKIDALRRNNGRRGIVKSEIPAQLCDNVLGKFALCERPRRDDRVPFGNCLRLFSDIFD